MTEQIVDLMEACMPGPRGATGPQGPQGLPGVDAVPADEAVAGYVTGPESSTRAALDVAVAHHGSGMHAVFLGDSITYGFRLDESVRLEKRYPALVCSTLGMIEHNYSVRGAGYTKSYADGPRTIGQQVDKAAADESYDHGRVGLVVVAAGINDVDSDAANVKTACMGVIDRLSGMYPNALIMVGNTPTAGLANMDAGSSAGLWAKRHVVSAIDEACTGSVSRLVSVPMWKLYGLPRSFTESDDGIHPGVNGHRRLGAMVVQAWHGSQSPDFHGAYTSSLTDANLVSDPRAVAMPSGSDSLANLLTGFGGGQDAGDGAWGLDPDGMYLIWKSPSCLRVQMNETRMTVDVSDGETDSSLCKHTNIRLQLLRFAPLLRQSDTGSHALACGVTVENSQIMELSTTFKGQADRSLPVGAFYMPCKASWNRDGTLILDIPANMPGLYLIPGRHYEYKINGIVDIDLNI